MRYRVYVATYQPHHLQESSYKENREAPAFLDAGPAAAVSGEVLVRRES